MAYGFDRAAAVRHGIDPASLEPLTALDRVAEIMAQGGDVAAITEICGYSSRASANAQVQVIRRQLGRQAC